MCKCSWCEEEEVVAICHSRHGRMFFYTGTPRSIVSHLHFCEDHLHLYGEASKDIGYTILLRRDVDAERQR